MLPPASVTALIVAAGRGTRAGPGGPKQYRRLGVGTVLARTLSVFAAHPAIADILVVIHPDDVPLYADATAGLAERLLPPAMGGATRQETVRAGLRALAHRAPGRVLVHDAARPFVDADIITRVLAALDSHAGAIAAIPVADTLKRASATGLIAATIDRAGLWHAQTPQGFQFWPLLAAHVRAEAEGQADFTDDAALAEWAGLDVALVPGSQANRKITTQEDLAMAAREAVTRSAGPADPAEYRTATGFDVHRFEPGDHVWLCGVRIPHAASLQGHSDADVGLHALTDALLGAIADGDIGQHFPPTDPRWKGAASHVFLADAARRVAELGGSIVNCDVTLLCESPRIGPHRDAMRARIAEIVGIAVERVSVKATTTEGLGFTGRREGIAAQAAATVRLPPR